MRSRHPKSPRNQIETCGKWVAIADQVADKHRKLVTYRHVKEAVKISERGSTYRVVFHPFRPAEFSELKYRQVQFPDGPIQDYDAYFGWERDELVSRREAFIEIIKNRISYPQELLKRGEIYIKEKLNKNSYKLITNAHIETASRFFFIGAKDLRVKIITEDKGKWVDHTVRRIYGTDVNKRWKQKLVQTLVIEPIF